jgi:hypothetical protein
MTRNNQQNRPKIAIPLKATDRLFPLAFLGAPWQITQSHLQVARGFLPVR